MNYIYYTLLWLFLSISIYSSEIGIRGYQFGESYSFVLNRESQLQEYQLIPSCTNNNRLVYTGNLFNKPMRLIFYFRTQRLSSISYLWSINTNEMLFSQYLQELLESKYQKYQTKNLKSQTGTFDMISYIQSTKNSSNSTPPLLYINLEKINLSNDTQNFILEFQAYDSDQLIKQKILLENI
ncbi:MAG: hypothetical protein ACRCWI_02980 [Brevinema sp.]